jgi:hypoxanthine phosphoribosyltransferase
MGDGIGLVITLIGVASGVIAIYEFGKYLRDRDQPTWRVVESSMKKVLKEMRQVDYMPDIVIAVGRGGAIVGGMVAGNLGHVPLFVMDTVLDRSKREGEVRIRFPDLCPPLREKSVLLAVGELYSGEDLRTVCRFVESFKPREVRTISLFSHPAASAAIRPDYIGRETKRPLDAPWRMTEAYRTKRL